MPSVRVTCPECDYTFVISDRVVGGLVVCRDCKAEFRVEFAEDEGKQDASDDRPREKAAPRTRSRPNVDAEPETWKSDLPVRSPTPILLGLVVVQGVVALLLAANWFFPTALTFASPTTTQQKGYWGDPGPTYKTVPSRKW